MVFPSLSPIVAIHRGEATNPSFVANVVDPVRHGHSLFKMMQQTTEIEVFVNNIYIDISICHDNMDTSYSELDQNVFIKVDEWWMTIASIKGHIENQGSWAHDVFNAIFVEDQDVPDSQHCGFLYHPSQ
ncbi:unnamed protein product [Sphagnum jensenii]|uniref:Uncharacterized protein n=1 Tax=Sphagnum jensenii TaxID=128206 RepID=A0ABP0XGF8_9BRYO